MLSKVCNIINLILRITSRKHRAIQDPNQNNQISRDILVFQLCWMPKSFNWYHKVTSYWDS